MATTIKPSYGTLLNVLRDASIGGCDESHVLMWPSFELSVSVTA